MHDHIDAEGRVWFSGRGNPAKNGLMIVFPGPKVAEANLRQPFSGPRFEMVAEALRLAGVAWQDCYITYAIKYPIYNDKLPNAGDKKTCRPILEKEINDLAPKVIITLGALAFEITYTGKKRIKSSDCLTIPLAHPKFPKTTIIPVYSPGYIKRNPQHLSRFNKDIAACVAHYADLPSEDDADVDYMTVTDVTGIAMLKQMIIKEISMGLDNFVVVDVETGGGRWAIDSNCYTRTFQINWNTKFGGAVIKLYPEGHHKPEQRSQEGCCPWDAYVDFINFLRENKINIGGHNASYDLMFLRRDTGIDFRDQLVYDTMLAEHLLDNRMALSLNEMAMRYTNLGKYDAKLLMFKHEHDDVVNDNEGYGCIPEDILFPYGIKDVLAPRLIALQQMPKLGPFLSPRGKDDQYCSIFEQEIRTSMDLIDIEEAGIPIDIELMDKLTDKYNNMLETLKQQFVAMLVAKHPKFGTDFNYRSVVQLRKFLFTEHGLNRIPIKTTDKPPKPWEWVMRQRPEIRKHHSPHTGMDTLKILNEQESDPLLKKLLDIKSIDQMCKNFLRKDKVGGITGNIWPDGRLHSHFFQLTDTGRFNTTDPNSQNWTKQAERFYSRIFEDMGQTVESMRSIVKAPEDWYIVEADYIQAELFELAAMAGDSEMMAALTTPGRDLHDEATAYSFKYIAHNQDLTPVDMDAMLKLAAEDIEKFESLRKTWLYIGPSGEAISRDVFKSGPRIAGKSVSFGIPYGRGAAAISANIQAETGLEIPASEVQIIIDGWKNLYSKAWEFICQCHEDVALRHEVWNAWGRVRRFSPVETGENGKLQAQQREGANFPIQSGVGDTIRIALTAILRRFKKLKLRSRISNQIHDALLALAHKEELDIVKKIMVEEMSGVRMPLPDGSELKINVDLELYERWGEKIKI